MKGKALVQIFPQALQGAKAQAGFLSRLQQPHELGKAYKNVVLNPNRKSAFSHIEFTPDSVRLEFLTAKDPQYRQLAEIATDDDLSEEDGSLIKDVKNRDFCGGGASVILDREVLAERLRKSLTRHAMLAGGGGGGAGERQEGDQEEDESSSSDDEESGPDGPHEDARFEAAGGDK
ncbi:unnamed protein product [Vitrella brassicaformis CCMP3155]|uniref:Uncharacterized protein n=2 Tax=Vitrella brassicaformis TaxID=1169539 RepID=A0A0G4F434_VITBC|nr:unnamed protein product [Vitrella brassicaformis CCMP3155]|mmetsp:Transcript_4460/g.10287  ORF Transcript_4460/g.10287 Transcript_4460/m.10287 type:complete len:176 (+) Transcript_4460:77-604(+)|eukprot:CEM06996.1 unnamed protein product [Vitrella brassicaformis CCMP3155]